MQGDVMTKKFNQVWINQTDLGKKFGLSAVNIGKILIEHQLKDPKSGGATQKGNRRWICEVYPPKKLNSPPPQWDSQFIAMAIDCGLSEDMQTNFEKVSRFYDRIIYKELIDAQKQTL
jgi:hypothetical protein